mgnify:CR=1 FL=1
MTVAEVAVVLFVGTLVVPVIAQAQPAPAAKVEPKGTEGPDVRKQEPKGTEGPDVRKSTKKTAASPAPPASAPATPISTGSSPASRRRS